ncbi:Phospholipid-transporting ATPase 2 [Tritrichomonas foetus]|uniref:Phospholipid-transporting ATPase n=1 Tax=Tritrichomonas foetus TaxID=1144522 RepID=A0A1J4K5Y0_9EUKA|nr:Phospholipid-transporting ATPase 2 [Tritrichomonas foetus]|eukprot:OHT05140.1 Phospholipid-transporting ATPase 2 [Tritrichomonas foetus]
MNQNSLLSTSDEEFRCFSINQYFENKKFCHNRVINSKYTLWNFLPLIVFYHCRRFMNAYFLIVGFLQLWHTVSPVNPLTTWIPILVIFAITFIREGIDDFKQHKLDKRINHRKYKGVKNGRIAIFKSEEFEVGDIIILNENTECPADIVILSSSNIDSSCYIETATLDGETSLKERKSISLTQNLSENELSLLQFVIKCNHPNPKIYDFNGEITQIDGNGTFNQKNVICSENFIPCGAQLKYVDYIVGIVCYTGHETKLGMNQQNPQIKWTFIEKFINKSSTFIFIVQVLVAILAGCLAFYFERTTTRYIPYLRFDLGQDLPDKYSWVILIIRCFLLTTTMIPISLKVTIDVCKFIYGRLISYDIKMKDFGANNSHNINTNNTNTNNMSGINATVNNSSVIEDLGSIEYLFSDKTGTLTENVMNFKKLSIENHFFGHSNDYDDLRLDESFKDAIRSKTPNIINVIYCLLLCNTLKFRTNNEIYGSSPEEVSFLKTLLELEFQISQTGNTIRISSPHLNFDETIFEVILVLPFSQERRRMSVIVRNMKTNEFYLFLKGATDAIENVCSNIYHGYKQQKNTFASQGLRVMSLAVRTLNENEVNQVCMSLEENRVNSASQESIYIEFESNSTLLGCVAIEDKLQTRIPETIEILRNAGIKIWMVTGDILLTAINIAYSSHLVTNDGIFIKIELPKNIILNENNSENNNLINNINCVSLKDVLDNVESYVNSIKNIKPYYIGIDGNYDQLLNEHKKQFMDIVLDAKSVICARVSPRTKAELVKCVQQQRKATLAIGDGGNDVPMIRAAHIGVGIIGHEGLLASNASDFSISKFCFLQRLLLIHGRYSNYRTAWLTQFCFYKSTIMSLIQLAFMLMNGFSGSTYFNSFNLMCYNAIFTLLPVIFFLQDKDIEESTVLLHPYVYNDSQKKIYCNGRTLAWWYIKGVYQAIILSLISFTHFNKEYYNNLDGNTASLDEAQQATYSALIFIVVLTVTLDTQHFTVLNLIFIWGNWVLYVFLTTIANCVFNVEMVKEMYGVMWRLMADPVNWIIIITMVSAAIFPPYIIQVMINTLTPSRTQILRIREIERESRYQPVYLVNNRHDDTKYFDESFHKKTHWDKSTSFLASCKYCRDICKKNKYDEKQLP